MLGNGQHAPSGHTLRTGRDEAYPLLYSRSNFMGIAYTAAFDLLFLNQ